MVGPWGRLGGAASLRGGGGYGLGGDFGAEDSIRKSSRPTLSISTSHMTPTHLMAQRRLLEVRVQPAHILAQHAGGAAHAVATRVDVV